jgi:hypothetical protein
MLVRRAPNGLGQTPANAIANSSVSTSGLLIGVGGLFAGGAAGAYVGGKDNRVAGILIGAVAGSVLAGVFMKLTGIGLNPPPQPMVPPAEPPPTVKPPVPTS